MAEAAGTGDAYLLYHSIGQYDGKQQDMTAGLTEFSEVWAAPNGEQWGEVLGKRQRFIDLWADLINAPRGTVATTENVTSGLMSVIGALPEGTLRGKKVLVAEDGFPSLHFLLTGLAKRFGFELVTVAMRQGSPWVEEEDMIAEWDENVALALLTWISSTSSHRLDIPRLVAHGREMGTMIGVDLTQGAGLLPYDVSTPAVDFALSTSLKWMCGTPGAGIIYVDAKVLATCEPELRGWFSQENPFSWALDSFAFAEDARRFNSGTPSTISAIASLPAMEWRMKQDGPALVAHNRSLTDKLLAGLDDMGLALVSPRDAEKRGGSLMVALPDEVDATQLVAELSARDIHMDNRSQILRMSPGFITTDAGVERTLHALADLIG
ncbi:aminotransferase class V-fold PLP-dependent enzyme [Pseudooceanicola sp. HF7]|uniref:aminotransferase class V-fold PLP-dependent enzyme n=1 Tax=Pseudooceanicola sp. HF7 TaxID=2721560 RepID=UPI001430C9C5|nr:aminotransferase class V-fold PLP-dependent enzyme [Pseudooceanicola sp. HF7]NIZ09524.1 aminotransferase class V-fold PLP-dependent enzyme [Pseudooceanicola sp. HF7]